MNRKFLSGFLAGALSTMLVIILGFQAGRIMEGFQEKSLGTSAVKQNNKVSKRQIEAKVDAIQELVDRYYLNKVNTSDLVNGIYRGYVYGLGDPYSRYYTEEELTQMMDASRGVYGGIGCSVKQDIKTGALTVVEVFKDGPAAEAGLKSGDIIYKVNGKNVAGQDVSAIISQTKGKEGTSVEIEVIRDGKSDPLAFHITRKKVENHTVYHKMLKGKIGYISVSEFETVTSKQFKNSIDALEKEGEKGLVIDVRNNPGGNLDTVVEMLDRMLKKGIIVYQEDKTGKKTDKKYATPDENFTKPCAVLINGDSASASEVFAGCLQDYKKAVIVGTTSFGKGIVQSVIPFKDGTAVKLTTAKYFTPKGRNIHGIGIKPDVKVELDDNLKDKSSVSIEEDNQIQKAAAVVKNMIKDK